MVSDSYLDTGKWAKVCEFSLWHKPCSSYI